MPEKDVLFSVTLPDGTKTTLNQEQYTQAQDKLFSKFPDAQVARVQSYVGDDDDQNDTDSYHIQLPDGTSTTLNATQFAGSRKKLMEKYPDAQIARISDMTDRYWRPKLEEAQAADMKKTAGGPKGGNGNGGRRSGNGSGGNRPGGNNSNRNNNSRGNNRK